MEGIRIAECVEREATIKRIKEVYCAGCNSYNGVRCRACGTGDAIDMIEDAPAADVAPVVRCKNCKWFADNNDGEWYGCQMFHVVLITPEDAPKPNDFCSYGERKDGGADNG